jgi:hypothetical protein
MKNTKTNVGSFVPANLKTISLKLIAIIAFVTVIGFSSTACSDGGGGSPPPPKPVEKEIQISDIGPVHTAMNYSKNNDFGDGVVLVPPGTEMDDPNAMSKIVALGFMEKSQKDANAITDNTWIWLFKPDYSARWTGTGKYDVYYIIYMCTNDELTADMSKATAIYKASDVDFKEQKTTEVKWDKFTKVTP